MHDCKTWVPWWVVVNVLMQDLPLKSFGQQRDSAVKQQDLARHCELASCEQS